MSEEFEKAMDQGVEEYKKLYNGRMKFVKKCEDRISACNMVMMRARDIERENSKDNGKGFVFNISTYDFENMRWDRCPSCGDPDINKISPNGVEYQGCFRCHILLGKLQIKSMESKPKRDSTRSNLKAEGDGR